MPSERPSCPHPRAAENSVSQQPLRPTLLNEVFVPRAHVSCGAWEGSADRSPRSWGWTHALPAGCPPCGSWELQGQAGSPPLAGDKADVIGLTVGVDPPRLPPLLIAGVNDMKHVPEAEAQGLAQEAAVLGLVIVKQGPGGQAAPSQSGEGRGPQDPAQMFCLGVYRPAWPLVTLPEMLWILRNPRTVWEPKALKL